MSVSATLFELKNDLKIGKTFESKQIERLLDTLRT